jgi:exonuclease VII large subunit
VRNYQQYLDDIEMRMDNITRRQIRRLSVRLNAAVAHIHSLNPKNPLNKGYALLKNAHGLYLGADKTVLQGDVVIVERKADELITEVKQIKDKNYEKED